MIGKIMISFGLLFFIALLFVSCSKETQNIILTPEDTAIRFVREMKKDNFTIDINSVEAIQTVAVNDLVLVLVQYNGERSKGGVEMCEMVLETQKALVNGWEAKNGSGLCLEIDDLTDFVPISVASSWGNSSHFKRGYSTAYGYVRDPRISKVFVTWEDGKIESVDVKESTYFTVREGEYRIKKIEAYNDQSQIIYENSITEELKE